MTLTTKAVYANGVLTPSRPLPILNGMEVDVTIVQREPDWPAGVPAPHPPLLPPTPEQQAALDWIAAADTRAEMQRRMTDTDHLFPEELDGYDVIAEMDKYRRATGQPPLVLRPAEGEAE